MDKSVPKRDVDVIVVGAGAAGLMAAATLERAGLAACVVEASGRWGGRVHTIRSRDWPIPIELGAEFLHGDVATVEALIQRSHARLIAANEGMWHLENGKLTPEDDGGESDEADAGSKLLATPPVSDMSAAQRIDAAVKDGTIDDDEARSLRGYVEGFYAAPADEISARALACEERGSGALHDGQSHRWPDGYDRLLEPLAMSADLRFDHVVDAIDWNEAHGVTVHTRSRSGFARKPLRARAAIVTTSIGVLRAKAGDAGAIAFHPPLPAATQAAIDGFRMGRVQRIALRFREPFWLAQDHYAKGAEPETLGYVRVAPPTAADEARRHWPTIWTLAPARVPILIAWAGGPAADRIEKCTEADRVAGALESIARGLGFAREAVQASLEDWRLSAWQADPFVRGAYAYPRVGHEDAAKTLAEPIQADGRDGKLYIAGEATCVAHAGTVHGALETGERAARDCMRALGVANRTL